MGGILVAGMGNVLRADDGFGVAVAQALAARSLPLQVRVIETGIGGMHLVHELMEGFDALVIVDAVDRGAEPGTLFILEPEASDPNSLTPQEAQALVSDMHNTVPARVLMLAKALGVLPGIVRIVGCQPADCDPVSMDMSGAVRHAVDTAVMRIEELIEEVMVATEESHAERA